MSTPAPSVSRAMRILQPVAVVTLLGGAFWIFKAARAVPIPLSTPAKGTLLLLAGLAAVCLLWSRVDDDEPRSRVSIAGGALLLAGLVGALGWAIGGWGTRLAQAGIDAGRADMLVQIREAVTRFAAGLNPYIVYYVPWELPLSYGPWLWMWYLVPHLLRADLRLVTIFGHAFIVALVAVAAALSLAGDAKLRAGLLAGLAAAVLVNPMFSDFLLIGHTPAYWPLIALFALTLAGRRVLAAAAVLGALLAARTTMVALVPIFLIYLWRTDRRKLLPAIGCMAAVVIVSFGPFLLIDWRTVVYGLYGNYVRVITTMVWTQTNWMASTLGLSRVLVANGYSNYVGLAQAVVMALVCAAAWWRLRPESPAPWFVVSLTAFSMTTLWPVWYVFLDVFVLGVALLAADWSPRLRTRPWWTTAGVAALAAATIAVTLMITPGVYYAIEPGKTPRWHLRSGFGEETDGFAWATRERVYLRVPRGLWTDAVIDITCAPYDAPGAPPQTLAVSLNGATLGQFALHPGVQTVSVPTRSRHWRIGHNDVVLVFGYALDAGGGEKRAARVGRIAVRRP